MKPMPSSPKSSPAPAPELIAVDPHATQVACDGGGGPLGHPLVYYSLEGRESVDCLYCDRIFVRRTA